MVRIRALWKNIGVLLLILLLAAAFGGCRGEEPAASTETTAPAVSTADTQADTQPTGTTQAQPQGYWVFAYGGLRVRSGPGVGYQMVGSLEDGAVVEPLQWKDGWAYIEEPVKGWCSADYLHELGWYKDVKTPEGTPPQDDSMKGKWVHTTKPVEQDGVLSCRAGIFRLSANGTFSHTVADFRTNDQGKWEVVTAAADRPYWVGEYTFDGKTLVLSYMAELEARYDSKTGEPRDREWVEWIHTLTVDVSRSGNSAAITNGGQIPLTVAGDVDAATENTLYKASNTAQTPADVCGVLDTWYE